MDTARSMNILDLVVGKPIATSEERAEQIGPGRGIPIFGLDALSSAAYGPEAALSLLIPLGLRRASLRSAAQHGDYRPARHCLFFVSTDDRGVSSGRRLVHRRALQSRAAAGAACGGGASHRLHSHRWRSGFLPESARLSPRFPSLQSHMVALCVGILIIITILNLRGLREAGLAFMFPTYLFVGTLAITIAVGIFRVLASGGHPTPLVTMPIPPAATQAVTLWLLLKAFSSGCAAITGVEAVSNGVKAFRDPGVKNAQRTLTIVILILAVLLAGISYLSKSYGITATDPSKPGYQSLLSLIIMAVFGRGVFYYITIAWILLVLSLSANTAFADFPRLCRSIALDNYLPHVFAFRGRRLVYTYGIIILALLTADAAHPVWRHYRSAHSALRRRRVPGVHALAVRYGRALAQKTRSPLG